MSKILELRSQFRQCRKDNIGGLRSIVSEVHKLGESGVNKEVVALYCDVASALMTAEALRAASILRNYVYPTTREIPVTYEDWEHLDNFRYDATNILEWANQLHTGIKHQYPWYELVPISLQLRRLSTDVAFVTEMLQQVPTSPPNGIHQDEDVDNDPHAHSSGHVVGGWKVVGEHASGDDRSDRLMRKFNSSVERYRPASRNDALPYSSLVGSHAAGTFHEGRSYVRF